MEANIKVEPLSPETLQVNGTDHEAGPDLGSRSFEYTINENNQSVAFQNVSMPVFPNMPYASSYSFMDKTHQQAKMENIPESYSIEMNNDAMYSPKINHVGKKSHLPKRYKCAMCAYRTRYKSDLNRHVRKHAVATFSCDICNMPFKTIGNVEFHKRKEHVHLKEELPPKEAMKHSCKMCTYATMYSSDLTRHVRKHYIAKFHCTLCNKPFMTSGSLVHHKRSAHGVQDVEVVMGLEGVESVKQTGGEIHSDLDMNEHKQSDVNGNINNTEREGSSKGEYTGHGPGTEHFEIENINGEDMDADPEEEYHYEDPDLEPPEILPTHSDALVGKPEETEKMNSSGAKHSCSYCNKTFGRKLVLEYHLKHVHKVFPRNDEMGDYVEYPDDYDLAMDMSIEELENSASSEHSSKAVTNGHNNGAYRHKCPFCAYATNYKSTYDRHVRKHELACHICNVCRMPFITFGHLQRHIRDNHPDHNQQISEKEITVEKHRCAYCNFEAESLDRLRMHTDSVHNRQIIQEIHRPSSNTSTKATSQVKPTEFKVEENKMKYEKPIDFSKDDSHTQSSSLEDGVAPHPPATGRYAKLVSDFDDFAHRPYACALCFYRTADISVLVKHAENHLTGCNQTPVPETAMFAMETLNKSRAAIGLSHRPITSNQNGEGDDQSTEAIHEPKDIKTEFCDNPVKRRMPGSLGPNISRAQQRKQFSFLKQKEPTTADRIIPTFSVHYRKDKTNTTKPYLCLLCRKRFRHLAILKQHFMQMHNETGPTNKTFECKKCSLQFNSPMSLQEHYEQKH